MPKKGQMSDQDASDELIRKNASYYNVVLYVPQKTSRVHYSSVIFAEATKFAQDVYTDDNLPGVRSAMVYAVQHDGRFAMMGSTSRSNHIFKPIKVKIY